MSDIGKTYEVPYPFSLERVSAGWDATGNETDGYEVPEYNSWRPGATSRESDVGFEWVADGMGYMLVTVVHRTELPKPYQPRVFYVRRWRAPSGKEFGKTNLRIASAHAFTRMVRGYRHDYILDRAKAA